MPMKCLLALSADEKLTLEQLGVNHRHRDIRRRAAGLVMLSNGLSAPKVAALLGVNVQSAYNWVQAWRTRGICGLLGGHRGGRHKALSETMLATAVQAARAESLTLRQIAQRVQAVHGKPLPCHLETLRAILKREGVSLRRSHRALSKKAKKRSVS